MRSLKAVLLLLAAAVPVAADRYSVEINQGQALFSRTPTPEITGLTNAPPGSLITVQIDAERAEITVGDRGEWTLVWPTELPAGGHQLTVTVTTEDGTTIQSTATLVVQPEGNLPRRPLAQDHDLGGHGHGDSDP